MFRRRHVRATAGVFMIMVLSACTHATAATDASTTPAAIPSAAPSAGNGSALPLTVPNVIGLSAARAAVTLRNADLRLVVKPRYGAHPYGSVVEVRPKAGSDTHKHVVITLWVGKKPPQVPDVTGESVATARHALEAAGYEVVVVGDGATVLKSNPPAGTRRIPGMKVTITMWTPPPPPSPIPAVHIKGPPVPPCIPQITC
jgi:hypothetical protein